VHAVVAAVLQQHELRHDRCSLPVIWSPGRSLFILAGATELHSRQRKGSIMDRAKMIDKLNEILRWEYAGLIQYTQFSFVVRMEFLPLMWKKPGSMRS
jgi:hypothetical protein